MSPSHSHGRHGASLLAHITLSILALFSVIAAGLYVFFIAFLIAGPVLERGRLNLLQSIEITDRKGGTLYQFSTGEERIFLPGNVIPEHVKKAVIAIEDERFLQRHACVDVRAIARAIKSTTTTNRIQGASTITQQLVRLLYLTREQTITRKTYEILLSCRLEYLLSKEEILTLYLNGVSFGSGFNGIESASQIYFGVPTEKLTLAQTATLVSIPQRPTYFSPYGPNLRSAVDATTLRSLRQGTTTIHTLDPSSVKTGLLPKIINGKNGGAILPGRSNHVLRAMLRLQFIDQKEFDDASKELLAVKFLPLKHPINSPHFSLWMRAETEELLQSLQNPMQWQSEGLTVRTTLDPILQKLAENVLRDSGEILTKAGARNASLVAVDRKTRQIVAYIGNIDFFAPENEGQIDMARAPRQPGSSFKPLIYAGAFMRGFTPGSVVMDTRMTIGNDVPKNYEGGYSGVMFIRDALARSRNIPAIKLFLALPSEDWVLDLGYKAGVRYPYGYKYYMQQENPIFSYGWPLAIGSVEVPLLEMVQLYATIAHHGVYQPLKVLCSVENREGGTLLQIPSKESAQAIEPQAADWVDEILRNSNLRPVGIWRSMLTIPGVETAAKTGTSNICFQRDAFGRCTEYGVNNVWTMGYTDELVIGVWAGNADNSVLDPLADGLTVAGPIWRAFTEHATGLYEPTHAACGDASTL